MASSQAASARAAGGSGGEDEEAAAAVGVIVDEGGSGRRKKRKRQQKKPGSNKNWIAYKDFTWEDKERVAKRAAAKAEQAGSGVPRMPVDKSGRVKRGVRVADYVPAAPRNSSEVCCRAGRGGTASRWLSPAARRVARVDIGSACVQPPMLILRLAPSPCPAVYHGPARGGCKQLRLL